MIGPYHQELLEVLQSESVPAFKKFVIDKGYFVAKSSPYMTMREWTALYHKSVLGYDELQSRWRDSIAWLASNGFFSMLL